MPFLAHFYTAAPHAPRAITDWWPYVTDAGNRVVRPIYGGTRLMLDEATSNMQVNLQTCQSEVH